MLGKSSYELKNDHEMLPDFTNYKVNNMISASSNMLIIIIIISRKPITIIIMSCYRIGLSTKQGCSVVADIT